MNIRAKLTVIFFSIVIIVLTIICVSVYFLSANYRQEDFYRRLKNRAINTAKILTEVEEVDANLLRRMERNNPASLPNQYIILYNQKNEVLYSSDGSNVIAVDQALLNTIRQQQEVRYTYKNFEALGFLFADPHDRFTVVAAATDVYGLDALRNLRNILIVTFCVSMVFVSILGWFFAGKVLSPISKIVEQVSNITEENLNRRLDEGDRTDELSKLAHTFNRMLERLQSAFASQKNFIANASHEIKTPITVMAGEIEVALLQDRDNDYYIKILGSVLGGLKGLNRLSTQLLLLAQTSTDQPDKNFAPLRIDDVLWEIKDELIKAFPTYRIDIHFDLALNHESLLMEGDEQLVKVVVLNLMDNGCKYSDDHQVVITLDTKQPGFIALHFRNTGEGIDAENVHRIFDPFFRGKRHRQNKGFGIGLSLVRQIVRLHGGDIRLESVPQQQTLFSVSFPVGIKHD
ncbi:Signal transduction histidine kinase [Chryseolinea serpens]|uniref:histidine kinase n=1 Tax=Chryseolinea serpens TaxID=947013 RepID=A0A1M5RE89_9BACT|nr:ATP-binding protein [Chryseolinea serpens]SHH24133.1 Signal transduction histidine kinase [Chryseolinea serpens]